jgi:hypothetical protein
MRCEGNPGPWGDIVPPVKVRVLAPPLFPHAILNRVGSLITEALS